MHFLRRLFFRAARELAEDPEKREQARQTFEHEVKPRARQAWKQAQPEIQGAKHSLLRFARQVREEYRKGRGGE